MKHSLLLTSWTLIAAACFCGRVSFAREAPQSDGHAATDTTENEPKADTRVGAADAAEEIAIRKNIESYVAAFNQGDAKAVAAHWSPRGEMITPAGEHLEGRRQLEQSFAGYFAEAASAKLELAETRIHFISPSVARETGIARVLLPEQEPSETVYVAVHVKTPQGWRIDSVREQAPAASPPSNYDQLRELEWMIGTWVNSDERATVETSSRWTRNDAFIVRSFRVTVADRIDMEGTQVLGWDPQAQTIRSWLFDSDGGFGVGRWTRNGDRWTVHTLNVLPDGRRASATNIYDLVDEKTVAFRSIGRQVDGELLPTIGPFNIVRAKGE